ncbi:hypothetical protein ACFSKM_12680 [Ancylobacter dichloromethanicus]
MSLPPRVWLQSRNGRALDLVAPRPGQVDFAEIADQLALINRYVGASSVAVSVANHTLIAYRVACAVGATERERALVLLHDVHESRIGDKAPPVKAMEFAIAREMFGATAEDTLRQVMAEIERRHDAAIHAAALVDPPSEAEKKPSCTAPTSPRWSPSGGISSAGRPCPGRLPSRPYPRCPPASASCRRPARRSSCTSFSSPICPAPALRVFAPPPPQGGPHEPRP